MIREEFIQILDKGRYSYEIEGDKIIITEKGSVYFNNLKTLPDGVVFKNEGGVDLDSLLTLPNDVEFRNEGIIGLYSLMAIPSGVEFRNRGGINLTSLIGSWINDWNGNIEGINSKRLLNFMISKGLFER